MLKINKLMPIIFSILMLYMAYKIIIVKVFPQHWMIADFSSPYLYIPIGSLFIIIGICALMNSLKQEKKEKYIKCPKCKETFNYSELENRKCKYCEDVYTIELEEYYEKYHEEKDV